MISGWKQELVTRAGELFARGNKAATVEDAQRVIDDLHRFDRFVAQCHAIASVEQSVNYSVAEHPDVGLGYIFPARVKSGARSRCEVLGCRDSDDTSIQFLWPGRLEVAGPQSRFNMRNWHPAKEAGYRCGDCSRGISLGYHPVVLPEQQRVLNLPSHFTQLAPESRLLHHSPASIERHGYVKKVEQACRQLQVLTGPEHVHRHPTLPPQRLADGSQLDNLRSRAERHEYAHGLSLSHRFAVMKSSGISWAVFDHTIGRVAKADSPR
jgi:hypothetical protein